jgi:hypothetical protein
MASERFVLCRRDVVEIGERRFCGKPIKTRHRLNWCDDCLARLPLWPGGDDWADRAAARRNARYAAELPLLALSGDLQQVTGEQVRQAEDHRKARLAACDAKMERRARRFRAAVARHVHEDALTVLDGRRAVLPPDQAYSADFWRSVLARLLGRQPGLVSEVA